MKVLKYLTVALVAGLVFYGLDAAAADGLFDRAIKVFGEVFQSVRTIVYILGAFGLIAIAIAGIMGKISFKWLGYLAAGLALVAGADAIVTFAQNAGKGTTVKSNTNYETYIKQ